MADAKKRNPTYGSVRDIPEARELEAGLCAARFLSIFTRKIDSSDLKRNAERLKKLTQDVDQFYAQLGPRNWVFHEHLSTSVADRIAKANTPDEAEQIIVEYYQDPASIRPLLMKAKTSPEAYQRTHLIDLAYRDFQEERYYSTVLLVITVVDGIANDVDPQDRRSLSTRDPDEMVPLSSVMSHHLGLSNAIRVFNKGVQAIDEKEATDVVRNGIVHGMTINYNNVVVAAKSLNLLFAVGDWVHLLRQEKERKPKPTLSDTFADLRKTSQVKRQLADFHSTSSEHGDPGHEESPAYEAIDTFLAAWTKRNFKTMAEKTSHASSPEQITNTKTLFREHQLTEYKILKINHVALHRSTCILEVTVDGSSHKCSVNLQYCEPGTRWGTSVEESGWYLNPYYPEQFLHDS